jgi:surface protein
MKLVERSTILPLDLVVLINSFLYERLTDENFKQAIALWFENKEECKFRFGHISDWNTSRVTNMEGAFYNRSNFNENIGQWDVSNVTNMRAMFQNQLLFVTGMPMMELCVRGGRIIWHQIRWKISLRVRSLQFTCRMYPLSKIIVAEIPWHRTGVSYCCPAELITRLRDTNVPC